MRLPTPRCAIRKHRSIVSVQHAVKQASSRRFVNVALGRVLIKDSIECEGLVLHSLPRIGHHGFGEARDGIVLWRVEDEAFVIDDLDDGSDAFLCEFRSWNARQRAVAEEERAVVAFCSELRFGQCVLIAWSVINGLQLCGFPDGKWSNSDLSIVSMTRH